MRASTAEPTVPQRVYWIDYLRSLNIIATVIFHSFLAYSPYLQNLDNSFKASFPMLDPNISLRVADLLLLLRPLFSMPLMFYLSGLFVWRGLIKNGPNWLPPIQIHAIDFTINSGNYFNHALNLCANCINI